MYMREDKTRDRCCDIVFLFIGDNQAYSPSFYGLWDYNGIQWDVVRI